MKIRVNGPIVDDGELWIYRYFGMSAVSPKEVIAQMDRAQRSGNSDISVVINSGGGSVFAASEIYTALKSHKGKVTIEIAGIAASAASVIAMAGEDIAISPTAQIMIHNAAMGNYGDYNSMDNASEILQNVNMSILNAYSKQTGKTEVELKEMMNKEVWMTAQQAKELGFVDRVMFEDEMGFVASSEGGGNGMLPKEVINEMKNKLASGKVGSVGDAAEGGLAGIYDEFASLSKKASELGYATGGSLGNAAQAMQELADINNAIGMQEEEEVMDLEKIKNEYPDLYNEIKNEGFTAGQEAEKVRIQAIEELAMPGNEDLVNAAKFENPISAEQLAVQIIKADKERGANYIKNRNDDAEQAGDISGDSGAEINDKDTQSKGNVDALVNAMGGVKK